jgi:phosphopantetheine adenylyltransferase
MKNYKHLVESLPSKTVVFAFGRFNPPTTGHELLVKAVKKLASMNKADHVIYASRTQNSKKDPLPVNKKIHYLNLMFPGTRFVAANEEVRTFIEAVKQLNKKYRNIIMVAGSDRVSEYKTILEKYNGKEFDYNSIQVISAGERDPDSDNASGMSATKMRAAATKGDYTNFKKGLPSHIRDIDAKLLMNDVREGLGLDHIKEQVKFQVDSIREQYFQGNIFKEGDLVESDGVRYTIIKRGSNHLLVENEEGIKVSKWIKDVRLVEDTPQGYLPKEISYMGYTTKNLHHSKDAIGAFIETIKRHGTHADNKQQILKALKATDAYMKLNDMHLEQQKAPDEKELEQWRNAHAAAREALNSVGEFMHHEDYWHNHEHELQDMTANFTPTGAGEPMMEELTNKTIKSNDKIKVARMIADFLGYESAEKGSNPSTLVNMALRKVKSKIVHKDAINILVKMLKLADEVGIDYDKSALPAKLKEAKEPRVVPINTKSKRNAGGDIMSYKDFKKSLEMNKGIKEKIDTDNLDDEELQVMDSDGTVYKIKKWDHRRVGHSLGNTDNDQLRRMKVRYKTEEVDYDLEEDIATADYKVNPETGRKYRAHKINFANSKANAKPDDTPNEDEDEAEYKNSLNKEEIEFTKNEKKTKKPDAKIDNDGHQVGVNNAKGFDAFFNEEVDDDDIDETELDKIADDIETEDDILDAYDDDELAIVDDETGEEIESDLKEEALNEVLSRQERIKAKIRFARTQAKRERKIKIALKRHSDTKTLNKRARKLAIAKIKQRLAKKPLNTLSVGEKERIERIVQKRKKVIDRLAMRLAPKVRKIEQDRLAHKKYTKE